MTNSWLSTLSAGLICLFRTRSLVKNGVRANYSLILRIVSTSHLLKRTICSIIRHHSLQQLQVMLNFTRLFYIIEFKYTVNLNLSVHEMQSIRTNSGSYESLQSFCLFKHASFYVSNGTSYHVLDVRRLLLDSRCSFHTLDDEWITWPALPHRDRSGEGRMRSPAHTDARQT